MKVLILGSKEFPIGTSDDSIRSGGMEYDISRLVPELVKQGIRACVITRHFGDIPFEYRLINHLEKETLSIYRVPWIKGKFFRNYSFNFFSFFKALEIIQKERIDVIHSVGVVATGVALLLKALTGVKVFAEPRGLAFNSWRFPINYFLGIQEKLFYPFCDKVGFQSQQQANKLEKVLGIKTNKVIVPTGINVNVKTNPNKIRKEFNLKDKFVVTFIGRFHVVKGLKYLLEAAKQLPKVTFLLVGEGDDINGCEIPKNVIPTGWREDVRDILSASDIFLLPSISEGVPTVLLEAMAEELPCIISGVHFPQVLNINPKSSNEIVEAISLIRECGFPVKGLKDFIKKNYSLTKCVDNYIKVYESLSINIT